MRWLLFFLLFLTNATAPTVALTEESTPETMVFDLFVGGEFRGDVLVEYTQDWVQIDDPRQVIKLLPPTRNPEAIAWLLTVRIQEEHLLENVGKVTVDPDNFRVDIPLDQAQLFSQKMMDSGNMPEAADGLSIRWGSHLLLNHDFASSRLDATFRHQTQATNANKRLEWDGLYQKNEGYKLTELNGALDKDLYTYSAGFLQSRGQFFAGSKEFAGFSIATTEQLLKHFDLLQATPLEVYIPTVSEITVRRNGELLYKKRHDFGLQQIDTKNFPEGSYTVEITIEEDNGTTTTKSRFFTKSQELPPRGKPIDYFALGIVRNGIEVQNTPLIQIGRRWRIADNQQLGINLYSSDKLALSELNWRYLYQNWQIDTGLMFSSQQDFGYNTTLAYRQDDGLNATVTYNRVVSEDGLTDVSDFDVLSRSSSSLVANAGWRWKKLSVGLTGTRSTSSGNLSYTYGPNLTYSLLRTQTSNLSARGRYVRSQNGLTMDGLLTLTYRPHLGKTYEQSKHKLRLRSTTQMERRYKDSKNSQYTEVSYSNRQGGATTGDDITINHRGTEDDPNQINTHWQHVGKYFTSNLSTNHQAHTGESIDTAGLELESSFIMLPSGKITTTPELNDNAAVLVQAKGDSTEPVKVLIDGRPRGTLKKGEDLLIPLPPYKTYRLELTAADKDALINLPDQAEIFSVYPGNLIERELEVQAVIPVLGQMVDSDGQPLVNIRITGTSLDVHTNEDGYFQFDLTRGEQPYAQKDGQKCPLPITNWQADDWILDLGTLSCF